MKLILSFVLLFSYQAFSQVKSQRVVIVNTDSKKDSIIKNLLLHNAIMDLIYEISPEVDLNPELFEKKLVENFNIYFENWKEKKIKSKFDSIGQKTFSQKQKKIFIDRLENSRAYEFMKFSRLSRLTDSYAFKKIENSKTTPNEWKGVVVLNLNKARLKKFFSRLQTDDNKQYEKLIILPEINLLGTDWSELGVSSSESFTSPLLNSWTKWLKNHRPSNVDEIFICQEACVSEFSNWLQMSHQEGMKVSYKFKNSLWLKVLFNVRKLSFTSDINEWKFEWDGSVVLLDSNTKILLSSKTIPPQKKTWRGLNQKELNSNLASFIYKSALSSFLKMTKKTEDSSRFNQSVRLVVSGHKHLDDIMKLIEVLRKEGEKIYLELKLDSFGRNEVGLIGFYQGEEKLFQNLLLSIKEVKSSQSFKLVSQLDGDLHKLKLVAE